MVEYMDLDFTLAKYKELCDAIINSKFVPLTVERYITEPTSNKFIILRHDVDKKPENALKMANIETEYGISATYYFRAIKKVFKPDIMKEIAGLGHEIGYHYEVLVKAKGDKKKAIEIFKRELNEFREICDINTICMHGNSLSHWDNRDIWGKYNFRDFDIIGEAYLSIDFDKVMYLSDSGGCWDNKRLRVKDIVDSNSIQSLKIKSTNDVIELVKNKGAEKMCILAHPDRWNDSLSSLIYELVTKKIRNVGKAGIVWCRRDFP
jgi:hypothetical protein